MQATYYKFTNEFAILVNREVVAYSGSNYAIPAQILQGAGHRLPSVKRSFPGRCGGADGDPPSDLKSI